MEERKGLLLCLYCREFQRSGLHLLSCEHRFCWSCIANHVTTILNYNSRAHKLNLEISRSLDQRDRRSIKLPLPLPCCPDLHCRKPIATEPFKVANTKASEEEGCEIIGDPDLGRLSPDCHPAPPPLLSQPPVPESSVNKVDSDDDDCVYIKTVTPKPANKRPSTLSVSFASNAPPPAPRPTTVQAEIASQKPAPGSFYIRNREPLISTTPPPPPQFRHRRLPSPSTSSSSPSPSPSSSTPLSAGAAFLALSSPKVSRVATTAARLTLNPTTSTSASKSSSNSTRSSSSRSPTPRTPENQPIRRPFYSPDSLASPPKWPTAANPRHGGRPRFEPYVSYPDGHTRNTRYMLVLPRGKKPKFCPGSTLEAKYPNAWLEWKRFVRQYNQAEKKFRSDSGYGS